MAYLDGAENRPSCLLIPAAPSLSTRRGLKVFLIVGLARDLEERGHGQQARPARTAIASLSRSAMALASADKSRNGCTVTKTSIVDASETELPPGGLATAWRRTRTLALAVVSLARVVGLGWLERRSVSHSFAVLATRS